MKKIFLTTLCFLFIFTVISCQTQKDLYTAFSENGFQLVFVRPVDFKKVNPIINNAKVDVTLHIKKHELARNPVCNYTLTVKKANATITDGVELAFVWETDDGLQTILPLTKERMFREIHGGKCDARFTLEFDKDDFAKMILSNSAIKVMFMTPEMYNVRFENHEFNYQIDNLRLMMN